MLYDGDLGRFSAQAQRVSVSWAGPQQAFARPSYLGF